MGGAAARLACPPLESSELSDLVEAVGTDDYEPRMLDLMRQLIGAQRCLVLMFEPLDRCADQGRQDRAASFSDALPRADLRHHLRHLNMGAFGDVLVHGPRLDTQGRPQRITVCGRRANASFGIWVARARQHDFHNEEDLGNLRALASLLISITAKHTILTFGDPQVPCTLNSLSTIYDCLCASSELSRREAEVCARILYGLTYCGIALDLGIARESVMTYRKRAYKRLGIGSQRELLIWYLARAGNPSLGGTLPATRYASVAN